ncbi:MAG: glutamate racemase, partial [Actinomycetota bacterium]
AIAVAREYLAALQESEVDTLVLGCTHYPLLTGVLAYVMGDDVTLVSSAEETAKDVYRVLVAGDMLCSEGEGEGSPTYEFLVTGDPDAFEDHGRRFLGPEIGRVSSL